MDSEVDTSILNTVNIKRFTKSVLEEYGAEVDRSNSSKWDVQFPDELARELDRKRGTLVFDAADREMGAGHLLVEPGTSMFSTLLDVVQQSGSVGHLQLTEDSLQVNPPTVLREAPLSVETTKFSERASDLAVAFHFRVQFETPSSFHGEEMYSVTIDPDTQTRLPELTDRLTSHLPQLLQENNEHEPRGVSESQIQQAFEEAQQTVINRSRPKVAELREEANESTSERIGEIAKWYDQRRDELDQQLEEQKAEIQKWRDKRQNARKDSTRREYSRKWKEAKEEYDRLQDEIEKKKRKLETEEHEEIEDVVDRNTVEVNVSLVGVTEVTYARGDLTLSVKSKHAATSVEVSYLPATDDFHGLDCTACSRDLTDGLLPRVCTNGHLVGDPCASTCRSCGISVCTRCESDIGFAECSVCWDDVCQDCIEGCSTCGGSLCSTHSERCEACGATTGHLCGELCSTCETFHCESHLRRCSECAEFHCDTHTDHCSACNTVLCEAAIETCETCGDSICDTHTTTCSTCDDTLCDQHSTPCSLCTVDDSVTTETFCDQHTVQCSVDGDIVCMDHRTTATLSSKYVCLDHYHACNVCGIEYSTTELSDGKCSACRSLGDTPADHVPDSIRSEFRTVEVGRNEAYMVILGKKLLGRNKIIVYDVEARTEQKRENAGMLKQLLGGYK